MARIVFDLDGTLIDSAPDIHAAVALTLGEEGRAPLSPETILSFVGNGLPHLVGLVIGAAGLDPARHADLTARTLAHYNAVSGQRTVPYPGVAAALAALAAAGHALGICTNKPEAPARHILAFLGLGPFDVVVGGDSLAARKPDPAPLHAALAALAPGPAIFVGDSEIDAETAERAGVLFLLFTEGYRKAPVADLPHAARFSDFAELPALVRGLQ
ncbi:MAG: phosphoglycolate phosphatase [Rhodobacteraceae bacterium]|nr:phosphoglycolate phosphatase [Paracoccaceae bacterium]